MNIIRKLKGNLNGKRLLLLSGFMFGLFFISNIILSFAASFFEAQKVAESFEQMSIWMLLLNGVIIAPVLEETICRFFLFYMPIRLIEKKGKDADVAARILAVVSTFIFAILHATVVQVIYGFMIGFVLCNICRTYKTVIASMFAHGLSNLSSILLTIVMGLLPSNSFLEMAITIIFGVLSLFLLVYCGMNLRKDAKVTIYVKK